MAIEMENYRNKKNKWPNDQYNNNNNNENHYESRDRPMYPMF